MVQPGILDFPDYHLYDSSSQLSVSYLLLPFLHHSDPHWLHYLVLLILIVSFHIIHYRAHRLASSETDQLWNTCSLVLALSYNLCRWLITTVLIQFISV